MYREAMKKTDEMSQLYWDKICGLYAGHEKACHHSAIAILNDVALLQIIDYLDKILY